MMVLVFMVKMDQLHFNLLNQHLKHFTMHLMFIFKKILTIHFPGPLDDEDWVGAFKDLDENGIGDVCVGARQWDTSDCGGGICDIPLMGVDPFNPEETADYMQDGDIPVFMIYDQSENAFYDAKILGSNGYDFANFRFSMVS